MQVRVLVRGGKVVEGYAFHPDSVIEHSADGKYHCVAMPPHGLCSCEKNDTLELVGDIPQGFQLQGDVGMEVVAGAVSLIAWAAQDKTDHLSTKPAEQLKAQLEAKAARVAAQAAAKAAEIPK